MIGTVDEISGVMAIVGFVFGFVLFPTLLNKLSYVPRTTSALTAAGLFVVSLCLTDLSLWSAAISDYFSTAVWGAIFIWRGTKH